MGIYWIIEDPKAYIGHTFDKNRVSLFKVFIWWFCFGYSSGLFSNCFQNYFVFLYFDTQYLCLVWVWSKFPLLGARTVSGHNCSETLKKDISIEHSNSIFGAIAILSAYRTTVRPMLRESWRIYGLPSYLVSVDLCSAGIRWRRTYIPLRHVERPTGGHK